MKKNYLVTGGSGFIGAALVKRLLSEGHNVRVLDNNSRGNLRRLHDVLDDIEFYNVDIRDSDSVRNYSKNIDCMCHLAYVNGTEFFYSKPELVLDVAIRGMLNVIDACRSNNILDLVVASSSEVYQSPSIIPTPENVALVVPDVNNPRFSYGGGKILSELMAVNYGRNGFERVVTFRPHNVYGPDMGWEHVIPQFIIRSLESSPNSDGIIDFRIKGNGLQTRSFIYIDDFIDGLMKVIEFGSHLECYHIGTKDEICIRDLALKVLKSLSFPSRMLYDNAPSGETNRRCPDIAKLAMLGFHPSINLDQGLVPTIDWYQQNIHLKP